MLLDPSQDFFMRSVDQGFKVGEHRSVSDSWRSVCGIHSRNSCGSSAPLTIDGGAAKTRVDSRATGSSLAGRPEGLIAQREPERRTAPAESRCADSRCYRGPPFSRFGANELQGTGGVSSGAFHGRLTFVFHAVLHVAVVDGSHETPLSRKAFGLVFLSPPCQPPPWM